MLYAFGKLSERINDEGTHLDLHGFRVKRCVFAGTEGSLRVGRQLLKIESGLDFVLASLARRRNFFQNGLPTNNTPPQETAR